MLKCELNTVKSSCTLDIEIEGRAMVVKHLQVPKSILGGKFSWFEFNLVIKRTKEKLIKLVGTHADYILENEALPEEFFDMYFNADQMSSSNSIPKIEPD